MTQLDTTRIPAGESVSDLLRELAATRSALGSTPTFASGAATISPQFVELSERQHRIVRMLRARGLSGPALGTRRGESGRSSSGESAHDANHLVEAFGVVQSQRMNVIPVFYEPGAPGEWPGHEEGLTAREAEVIALITSGLTNNEIANRTYLTINSVKSYIRSAYRTMGVTSRSKAVLWGIDHGMAPTRTRSLSSPSDKECFGRLSPQRQRVVTAARSGPRSMRFDR